MPGRTTVVVPITVTVPAAATPGDHSAGIVVSLTSDARNERGDVVHVDQRVAVRAHFRVSGALSPNLVVEDLHASYAQSWNPFGRGHVLLSYTVHNTGNVRLAATQQVSFAGLFGTSASGPALPDIPVLLPGASVQTTATIDDVWPALRGSAVVRLVPSAAAGDTDPRLAVVEQDVPVWTIPIMLVVLLVTITGAVVGRRLRRTRRRPAGDEKAADATPPTEPEPELVEVGAP